MLDSNDETDTVERQRLSCIIADLVGELVYYNRKEDEEMPRGKIESMVRQGQVTVDEMVDLFRRELTKVMP